MEGQDSEISNNGLEMDETIQEYTERLLQKVAPMIISWILQHYRGSSRRKWICCLQEVPGHRHLRRDLLQKVQAGLKDKGASLQSAEHLGHAVAANFFLESWSERQGQVLEMLWRIVCLILKIGILTIWHFEIDFKPARQATSAFMCTVTLWETAAWDLQHCAHSDHVLCTVLSSKGTGGTPVLLRVMNCHLPLDQGLISSTESTSMARVVQLLAGSPAQQVALVVGDLKLDLAVEGAAQTLREAYAKCDLSKFSNDLRILYSDLPILYVYMIYMLHVFLSSSALQVFQPTFELIQTQVWWIHQKLEGLPLRTPCCVLLYQVHPSMIGRVGLWMQPLWHLASRRPRNFPRCPLAVF